MSKVKKTVIFLSLASSILAIFAYWFITTKDQREFSRVAFQEHCANCHDKELTGTNFGPTLLANALKYGSDVNSLASSIENLDPHKEIVWPDHFPDTRFKALALFVAEQRENYPAIVESYKHAFTPQTVQTQHHNFTVEKYSDLVSHPYSIAPLPDGRILVAEKVRGLSIIDNKGKQGPLVTGIPKIYDKFISVSGSYVGWGHLLEVALHPNYENNGWIYLSYSDRCQLSCGSPIPKSMVKVIRGRIKDNKWNDEEVIWSVDKEYYTIVPDAVAGGRLAFDKNGYLYITIGGKAFYKHLHDMNTPYGKVHRVKDDGTIPTDNPFWTPTKDQQSSSTSHTVWSYGHRTNQGLDSHPLTGEIWSSEMGPRGGDEVNKITKQGNYGWPLYTNGLDYDSSEISIGEDLGLDFPIEETILPTVDFTPAPALSNLTFHNGDTFPLWKNDMLIGSLKAMTLYRLRIENNKLIEKETLATGIGRIRDIEMGSDGLVYIAIEHGDSGSIVRLSPHY